jgi:hypothetical protein
MKSNRSRNVIYASGGQLSPAAARASETIDGDGMREPEKAEISQLLVHGTAWEGDESLHGGVGGASVIRRPKGTTAVDMVASARI